MKDTKSYTFLCLLVIFGVASCSINKWHKSLLHQGGANAAVANAVMDFVNTSKWCKRDSVFMVDFSDQQLENAIMVTIKVADEDAFPSSNTRIGSYDPFFPTSFIEMKGKLFYWNDSSQTVSKELFEILEKYNNIDYRYSDLPEIVGGVVNENEEGTIYLFYKEDLTKYKKRDIAYFNRHPEKWTSFSHFTRK